MALSATGIRSNKKNFTLLELICVMAISALLIGLVVGRVGKIPAYLSFKNALANVANVMDEASNQSELTGRKVVIVYDNGTLSPEDNNLKRRGSTLTYQLPPFVDVTFKDNAPNKKQFVFFPDGSSSGPDMSFAFKGHTAILKLSKLTGMPILKIDDQQ